MKYTEKEREILVGIAIRHIKEKIKANGPIYIPVIGEVEVKLKLEGLYINHSKKDILLTNRNISKIVKKYLVANFGKMRQEK